MTYLELYEDALRKLHNSLITLGEFEMMVKPLNREVEAEPKTGEWIKATDMMPPEFHGHHCCSECGAFANMDAPYGNREDLSNYCPNCGSYNGGKQK